VTYPTNAAVAYTIGSSFHTDFLMTARARLGWAVSNWLVYGTGGAALTDLTVTNTMADTATLRGNSSSVNTKLGWAAGAGVEYALSRSWTLSGEYLHVEFGTVATTAVVGTAANNNILSTSSDLSADIFRTGLSYRF
jgi:outer membrane immunogenic protein